VAVTDDVQVLALRAPEPDSDASDSRPLAFATPVSLGLLQASGERTRSRERRLRDLRTLRHEQSAVVHRAQLRSLGWTPHQIQHEIDVGRWQATAPSVLVMHNGPLATAQRCWLGVLHAGASAALSHGTVLSLAGLKHWETPVIDVLTAKGWAPDPLDGFFFRQSRRNYLGWLHPVRKPRQIRIDLACLLAAERKRTVRMGVGLVAATVQQRLTTASRLYAASLEVTKLRHGKQIRLALLDIAGGTHSFGEIDVGQLCREHGLAPPLRQRFRLDARGRRRYLDCEWELPDGTIVVLEVDGGFHFEAGHWWRDMQRERGVVITVGRVLRCSTLELRLDRDAIARDLLSIGVPRFV